MKLALTFIVDTDRYPSTFNEIDMITAIAIVMGVEEDAVEYDLKRIECVEEASA